MGLIFIFVEPGRKIWQKRESMIDVLDTDDYESNNFMEEGSKSERCDSGVIRLTRFPPLRFRNLSSESSNAYHFVSGVLHILRSGIDHFVSGVLRKLDQPLVKTHRLWRFCMEHKISCAIR